MSTSQNRTPPGTSYIVAPTIIFLCVIVLGFLMVLIPDLTDIILRAGDPSTYVGADMHADYTYGVLWGLLLGVSMYFWPIPRNHKVALLWVWVARLLICLGFMLVYERYLGFDNDGYFPSPGRFTYLGLHIGSGADNVRQLTLLLSNVLPVSFHAFKVTFSMIGLIGSYMFYMAARFYLEKDDIRLLYCCTLFPSVLLWSSLLGKDPIGMLGMSFYAFGVSGWYFRRNLFYLILVVTGMLICIFIRPWFGLIMVIPLIALLLIVRKRFIIRCAFSLVLLISLPVFFGAITEYASDAQSIDEMIEYRLRSADGFASGGSGFKVRSISGVSAAVMIAPLAIFTALFRPLPWEAHNAFAMLVAIENTFLVFLLWRAFKRTSLRELLEPMTLWMLALSCTWATFYGLVANNFGALVRFKLQILPILVCLLLLLARDRKNKPPAAKRPRISVAS